MEERNNNGKADTSEIRQRLQFRGKQYENEAVTKKETQKYINRYDIGRRSSEKENFPIIKKIVIVLPF